MTKKDFLTQFSGENKKPDSFKEEERKKVVKEKKPINKVVLIIVIAVLLILCIASYFIFFAPKIEMPDFVYQTKTDVAAWVKQQGIDPNGIIMDEEYNFEYDEGTILSQSIEAGKKVKEDVKINFTVSIGADPNELISVPDLNSMEKDEIKDWISENKLTKTKISTTYSEAVEENRVISYEFVGCEEDSFTRSSTLKISVSKGSAPAGTITVEDFTNKDYSTVELWANSKKIVLNKSETYSDKVAEGLVITQSISSGKTMKEGETLSVSISKGKGILVPDLTSMSKEDATNWLSTNGVITNVKSKYSNSSSFVISQSIKANTMASAKEIALMSVEENLGSTFYLQDFLGSSSAVGMNYNKVVDVCNNSRSLGIDAFVGNWDSSNEEYSYNYKKGTIVSVKYSSHSTGKEYFEGERMPLDLRMNVVVSKGLISRVDISDLNNPKIVIDALATNGIAFSNTCDSEQCQVEIKDVKGNVIDISNRLYSEGTYEIYEDDVVTLVNK